MTERPARRGASGRGFTPEEKAALRERARELRAAGIGGEAAVLAKIGQMPEPDRTMAGRLHAIIMAAAPDLVPRLRYGMPGYARGSKVVGFFQSAHKFKTEVRNLWLYGCGEPRRRGHVARCLRTEGTHRGRRGKDCCPGKAGGGGPALRARAALFPGKAKGCDLELPGAGRPGSW